MEDDILKDEERDELDEDTIEKKKVDPLADPLDDAVPIEEAEEEEEEEEPFDDVNPI